MPGHLLFRNWRDTRNPEGGGSEVYVERIAAELVARGFRATLFCAAHSQAPADEVNEAGGRRRAAGGGQPASGRRGGTQLIRGRKVPRRTLVVRAAEARTTAPAMRRTSARVKCC
ncbi:hypothetical protein ONO86_03841 [Micromonospora noduli]|nr:hypothetical protein ONO86_03841 [Micromonospora noduli]